MTFPQAVTVLLVDDDQVFRQGIKTLLQFCGQGPLHFQVIGEVARADQALEMIKTCEPELVLLDLELREGNGVAILDHLRQVHSPVRTLVLSAHQEDEWIFRVMQSGAHGYLLKEDLADHLLKALTTVLNCEVYLPPSVATCFFRQFTAYADEFLPPRPVSCLTEREHEVLQYLIEGYSNHDIAKRLFITTATVKAHLTAIYTKLKVNSRSQAIVAALKLGVVSLTQYQMPLELGADMEVN